MIDFNRINDVLDKSSFGFDEIEVDVDPREPTDEEANQIVAAEVNGKTNSVVSASDTPQLTATATLDRLLDRLRRGEGDKLFSAGEAFSGFEVGPGKLSVLGAPPGLGKTAATSQFTYEALAADPELRVYVANAEMSFDVLLNAN